MVSHILTHTPHCWFSVKKIKRKQDIQGFNDSMLLQRKVHKLLLLITIDDKLKIASTFRLKKRKTAFLG